MSNSYSHPGKAGGLPILITSFVILGQPVPALFFLVFNTQNPVLIALAFVFYAAAYVLLKKNKPVIHEWLEKAAARSVSAEN
jgi:PTS system galactitol-specific IIC component